MTMKIITAIAVASSVLVMSNVAEAGSRAPGVYGGEFVQKIGHKRHRKHRHAKHGLFYDHGYYYGHNPYRACRWLKRKARYTGSHYWWKRYQRCMDRYFY